MTAEELLVRLIHRLDREQRLIELKAPQVIIQRERLLIHKAMEAGKVYLRPQGYLFHGDLSDEQLDRLIAEEEI